MAKVRYLGIGEEVDFKTAVAAAKYIDVEAENIQGLRRYIVDPISQSQALQHKIPGREGAGGSFAFAVRPDNITNVLKWVMGSVASAVQGATSAYKHTFKMDDTIKSFTARVGKELDEEIFAGCIIDSLVLTGPAEDDLGVAVSMIGGKMPTTAAIGSPTFSSLASFPFQQNTVKIGGVAAAYVEAFALQINRTIDDYRCQGSVELPAIQPQARLVSGNMLLDFQNTEDRLKFLNDTETTLQFKFVGAQIGATGYFYTVDINLPKAWYVGYPSANIAGRTRFRANAAFVGRYDSTDTELKIEVTNEETTI